jgi:hypothetical protein
MSSDEERPLRAGDVLGGFCEGYFGRDSYGDKRVEEIGPDWVVVRYESGTVDLFQGDPQFLVRFRTGRAPLRPAWSAEDLVPRSLGADQLPTRNLQERIVPEETLIIDCLDPSAVPHLLPDVVDGARQVR